VVSPRDKGRVDFRGWIYSKRWRWEPRLFVSGGCGFGRLSIDGEFGVRHVMKSLLADFDILMTVAG